MTDSLGYRVLTLEKAVLANGRPSLEDRMREEIKSTAKELDDKVDERHEANLARFGAIESHIAQANGAARATYLLGTIAGTIAVVLIQHFWK